MCDAYSLVGQCWTNATTLARMVPHLCDVFFLWLFQTQYALCSWRRVSGLSPLAAPLRHILSLAQSSWAYDKVYSYGEILHGCFDRTSSVAPFCQQGEYPWEGQALFPPLPLPLWRDGCCGGSSRAPVQGYGEILNDCFDRMSSLALCCPLALPSSARLQYFRTRPAEQ